MDIVHGTVPDLSQLPDIPPQSVNEAVNVLMSEMILKDKTKIVNMSEFDLEFLNVTLGQYIRNNFRLSTCNDALMESCKQLSGKDKLHPDMASQVIIEELWKKLSKTHKLRMVK